MSAAILLMQQRLASALRTPDPVAAVRAIADDPGIPPHLAHSLRAADARGIAISALIVAKLRFEHLMQTSRIAAEWFERDGAAFARAFRAWHECTPPGTAPPAADARSFERFVETPAAD